jgi:hypothetical protein
MDVPFVLALCVLGTAVLLGLTVLLRARRAQREAPPDEPLPYDDRFDRRTIITTLDWYILRHLEDRRHRPAETVFLDDDRHHNDVLNRYVAHRLSAEGDEVPAVPSSLSETIRAGTPRHYTPGYFPDAELDGPLGRLKDELISNRYLSTIAHLERIKHNRAESLRDLDRLKPGCTPFVCDAYVTFYEDLVLRADAHLHQDGLREKLRLLAVRMVFPGDARQVAYWRDRGLQVSQVRLALARDTVEGWFYLDPSEVPLAGDTARG